MLGFSPGTGGYFIGVSVARNMRVAVVADQTAYHDETAAALRIRNVSQRLAGRGHDVTTFCSQWWGGDESEFDKAGVTYHAITVDLDAPARRWFTRLPQAVRELDPDVIHAAHADPFAILAASLAGSLARIPLVVDWYDVIGAASPWQERAWWVAARAPDVVITPSRLVRTGVREIGRPADDIRVIPTGIDMDQIRAIDPDPLADIVYSRELDEDANLGSLLLGLAELRDMAWEAVVIGDGPFRRDYEDQARDLRIADRIDFVGEQPLERRLAAFKGAHVAVHTARKAPFAIEFLRALACGCVGIAEYHAQSSATELIERRQRGFRVTSDEELAEAIRSAADLDRLDIDEDFARFDQDEVLDRYLECYEDLC